MNFWHMQLHPDNSNWGLEKEVLEKTKYIGLGNWKEKRKAQQLSFQNDMHIGDIVAIKRGETPIALVKVIGEYEYDSQPNKDFDWFERRRKVEILDWYDTKYKLYIAGRKTLTKCDMTNSNAHTNKSIKTWYEKIMNDNQINKVAELLKYKYQIILQGPPGTGKTRLAKLIAQHLTHTEQKGKPQDILDKLIQDFDSTNASVQTNRTLYKKLLTEFKKTFPINSLEDITLDEFAIGTGENHSFCWWLEIKLQELGRFSPGSSNNYPIYWSKDKTEYVINKKVGEDIHDAESAMQIIANQLYKLVQETDLEESIAILGKSFTLKVLSSYYPDRYFPINSEKALDHTLKLFGAYTRKMSLIEKNQKLYSIYRDKKEMFAKDITVNEFAGLIWSNFNLKDGESLSETDEVITRGEYKVVQFHPAYTYEDFVRGVVAKTNEDGNIHYKVENKILAQFAKIASENPNSNYVLIIDEINRANLPSVLGELIYALEYRGKSVQSVYELSDNDSENMQSENTGRNITLPKNLYIIGTMNTADRSIGHIDYAIRRRFAFYNVLPNVNVVKNEQARRLYNEVMELFDNTYLSADFDANDVRIGHSYFIASDKNMSDEDFILELRQKLKYEIKPILYEYIKDGILLDSAKDIVKNLHV